MTELAVELRRKVNDHPLISKYFHILTPAEMVPAEFRESGIDDFGGPGTTWHALLDAMDGDEFALDPTRLTLFCGKAGFDGTELKNLLAERFDIQLNKTSRNSVLLQININNSRSDIAHLIKVLADLAREIDARLAVQTAGERVAVPAAHQVAGRRCARAAELHALPRQLPATIRTARRPRGTCAAPSTPATGAENCAHVKLNSKEMDQRLDKGPELVAADFVIPYPPGFPDHGARAGDLARDDRVHAQARCKGNSWLQRGGRLAGVEAGGSGGGCRRSSATACPQACMRNSTQGKE